MSLKISAKGSVEFIKLEETLSKLDKDFINKYESAGYVLLGYSDEIELITSSICFNEEAVLPKGFVIEQVEYETQPQYEKDSKGIIIEKQKYNIIVKGVLEGQRYKFIYNNLYKIDTLIRIGTR